MPPQMRACGTTSRIEPAYRPMQGISRAAWLELSRALRRARSYLSATASGHAGAIDYGVFLGHYSCAQAAGTTARDLLSREIFAPMGMTRTGPTFAELLKHDNHASSHDLDGSVMPFENAQLCRRWRGRVDRGRHRPLVAHAPRRRRVRRASSARRGDSRGDFHASMVQGTGGPLRDPNDSPASAARAIGFCAGE